MRTSLRARRDLLLVVLPLATGAGLVIAILTDFSLPVAIAFVAAVGLYGWWIVLRTMTTAVRRGLRRRVAIGACAGFVGTLAYDTARYGVVALFDLSFQPFHVFAVFGELFIGATAPLPAQFVVGFLYHLTNGACFGIAYALTFKRPGIVTGILWGCGLELCMALLYPSWLRIIALGEFLEVSAIGHVVYGSVLGLIVGRLVRTGSAGSGATRPVRRR